MRKSESRERKRRVGVHKQQTTKKAVIAAFVICDVRIVSDIKTQTACPTVPDKMSVPP